MATLGDEKKGHARAAQVLHERGSEILNNTNDLGPGVKKKRRPLELDSRRGWSERGKTSLRKLPRRIQEKEHEKKIHVPAEDTIRRHS